MVKTPRCEWCGEDPLYIAYHDQEWGVPVREPNDLFERLVLEGMQVGLSWLTVLRKRAHMRVRFCGFDPAAIDRDGPGLIASWLTDPSLIRHRGTLQAVIGNARACLATGAGFVNDHVVTCHWHRECLALGWEWSD